MKNQYFGDVGDFGKYALLLAISKGLSLGINWYLTPDDASNDGKHIDYKVKNEFKNCDQDLCDFLSLCITKNKRFVSELTKYSPFQDIPAYEIPLKSPNCRKSWFEDSLAYLEDCDLLFCDPDNGIKPASIKITYSKSIKYIFACEIKEILEQGKSLIVYNHRDRKKHEAYIDRLNTVYDSLNSPNISLRAIRFHRNGTRDFFIFIQGKHKDIINHNLNKFLETNWNNHFKSLHLN